MNATAFNYPSAPPPSTAATAITRDDNAGETSVSDYFDNAIRNLGLPEDTIKVLNSYK